MKRVVILSGDAPLISGETIKNAIAQSEKNHEYATIFTADFEDPTGYGRIVRDANGAVCGIVGYGETILYFEGKRLVKKFKKK